MMSKKEKALEEIRKRMENMLSFIMNNKGLLLHYLVNNKRVALKDSILKKTQSSGSEHLKLDENIK
ncbi:MAG: hypothetical protein ACK4NF_01590 [Planctomycetota bacterium]